MFKSIIIITIFFNILNGGLYISKAIVLHKSETKNVKAFLKHLTIIGQHYMLDYCLSQELKEALDTLLERNKVDHTMNRFKCKQPSLHLKKNIDQSAYDEIFEAKEELQHVVKIEHMEDQVLKIKDRSVYSIELKIFLFHKIYTLEKQIEILYKGKLEVKVYMDSEQEKSTRSSKQTEPTSIPADYEKDKNEGDDKFVWKSSDIKPISERRKAFIEDFDYFYRFIQTIKYNGETSLKTAIHKEMFARLNKQIELDEKELPDISIWEKERISLVDIHNKKIKKRIRGLSKKDSLYFYREAIEQDFQLDIGRHVHIMNMTVLLKLRVAMADEEFDISKEVIIYRASFKKENLYTGLPHSSDSSENEMRNSNPHNKVGLKKEDSRMHFKGAMEKLLKELQNEPL